MPKLPPPAPRQAQNRSLFSRALQVSARPSASTMRVSFRPSQVRPCARMLKPMPPPSTRPGHADFLAAAMGHRAPEGTAGRIDVLVACTATEPGHAGRGVDVHRMHLRHIDHQAAAWSNNLRRNARHCAPPVERRTPATTAGCCVRPLRWRTSRSPAAAARRTAAPRAQRPGGNRATAAAAGCPAGWPPVRPRAANPLPALSHSRRARPADPQQAQRPHRCAGTCAASFRRRHLRRSQSRLPAPHSVNPHPCSHRTSRTLPSLSVLVPGAACGRPTLCRCILRHPRGRRALPRMSGPAVKTDRAAEAALSQCHRSGRISVRAGIRTLRRPRAGPTAPRLPCCPATRRSCWCGRRRTSGCRSAWPRGARRW